MDISLGHHSCGSDHIDQNLFWEFCFCNRNGRIRCTFLIDHIEFCLKYLLAWIFFVTYEFLLHAFHNFFLYCFQNWRYATALEASLQMDEVKMVHVCQQCDSIRFVIVYRVYFSSIFFISCFLYCCTVVICSQLKCMPNTTSLMLMAWIRWEGDARQKIDYSAGQYTYDFTGKTEENFPKTQ